MNREELRRLSEDSAKTRLEESLRQIREQQAAAQQKILDDHWAKAREAVANLEEKTTAAAASGQVSLTVYRLYRDSKLVDYEWIPAKNTFWGGIHEAQVQFLKPMPPFVQYVIDNLPKELTWRWGYYVDTAPSGPSYGRSSAPSYLYIKIYW